MKIVKIVIVIREKGKIIIALTIMMSLLISLVMSVYLADEKRNGELFQFGNDRETPPKTSYYDWNQTSMNVNPYTTGIYIADANNDGYNDLITANGNDNSASILTWNESMHYWNEGLKKEFGEAVGAVIVKDANNDGFNDLIARNSENLTIILWDDILKDWVDTIHFQIGSSWYNYIDNFDVEDANNDGYNDVIINDEWECEILLWNHITNNWNSPIIEEGLGINLIVKDANNDGFNDLIAYHPWAGTPIRNKVGIRIWNSSIGYWNPTINVTFAGDYISSLSVEDVNNDGYNDLITTNYWDAFGSDEAVSIRLWNNDLQDWGSLIVKPMKDANSVNAGDVNNDGFNDIIFYSRAEINYHWKDVLSILVWDDYHKNWKDPINKVINNPDVRPGPIISDVDNDGDNDIACLSSGHAMIDFISWEFIDIYDPIVIINSPQDGDAFYLNPPSFSIEIIDNSTIDSMWYSFNGGLTNHLLYDNGTISAQAWEEVLDGTVKITFYANDTVGNIGFGEVTVYKNMELPSLQFNSPSWNATYSYFFPIDFTFNDGTLDEIRIIVNNSPEANYSVYPYLDHDIYYETWSGLDDGQVYLEFHAKDILGKDNIYIFVINKDNTAPIITINSPKQYDEFWKDPPHFDISIEEPNLDTVWYEIEIFYYKSANFTITEFTGSVDKAFWESLGDDYLGTSCRITFYANDTLGHMSSKSVLINRQSSGASPPLELILIGSIIGGTAMIGIVLYSVIKTRIKKRNS